MNREQAVKYLSFSGFSDEQIKAIEGAFSCPSAGVDCEDCPAYGPKTGYWVKSIWSKDVWECSECGWEIYDQEAKTNYCPSCGCRMVEPQESEEV